MSLETSPDDPIIDPPDDTQENSMSNAQSLPIARASVPVRPSPLRCSTPLRC